MKIAITADPEIPIPPNLYGGAERLIDMLIHGLVERGHKVTLFAHPESNVPCTLVPYYSNSSRGYINTVRNMMTVSRVVKSEHFDLIHSLGRLAYLIPLLPLKIPKIMTYQREITPRSIRFGSWLSNQTLHFSSISKWMTYNVEDIVKWHLVYNGVPMKVYDFNPLVDDNAPLVFLGRIEYIKGPHLAIEIAKKANKRLIIAGNISSEHQKYFNEKIMPHIDGINVTYIGPVNDIEKNILLRQAAAFLMPILWEEPFGLVMAEAMACGTPVLGLNRGAVPEIVEHGVTGFVGNTVEELIAATSNISFLERADCRKRVERYFSETSNVEGYIDLYKKITIN